MGIWLLYYLRFTNYSGVGIIESFAIFSSTFTEIPTGAIADLLGKKKTLSLAFFVGAIAELIMGFSSKYVHLIISVIIVALSHSLYSGTIEALLYDSLKESGKEDKFNKVISNLSSIGFVASAFASITGGFIYSLKPSYPYLFVSLFYFIGFFLTFFLKEPSIDTEKFNFKNYLIQTKQGFKQLFKTEFIKKQTQFLLITGLFSVIAHEVLVDSLAIEYGFKAQQLGFLIAFAFIISALVSQLTPFITNKYNKLKSIYFINIIISLFFIIAPILKLISGGLVQILWAGLDSIQININSIIVNQNTESKYRATTISTLKMIKQTPYLLSAYFIGYAMDLYSAKYFAFIFGILLLTTTLIFRVKKEKSL